MNQETLVKALYGAYCDAVGGKAFNGVPLPSWDEFAADDSKKKQADAWHQVAQHALKLVAPPPHVMRLVLEKDELDTRLDKLNRFIAGSPLFPNLPQADQDLLRQQAGHMAQYAEVLKLRLERAFGA